MKIKELLTDGSKWTQNCSARDAGGQLVHPHSALAAKWCLHGAAYRCYGEERLWKICDKFGEVLGDYVAWNDDKNRTWKEVKDLINGLDV